MTSKIAQRQHCAKTKQCMKTISKYKQCKNCYLNDITFNLISDIFKNADGYWLFKSQYAVKRNLKDCLQSCISVSYPNPHVSKSNLDVLLL